MASKSSTNKRQVPMRRARRKLNTSESRVFGQIQRTQLGAQLVETELYSNTHHLHIVGGRANFREYLEELWNRRYFILRDARNRVISQNTENRLGVFWLILRPLLDVAFYAIIFGLVLKISRGMDNYIAWLIVGLLMFRFTSSIISSSTRSIRASRAMIRSFNFPRASIPISLVVKDTINQFLVVFVMLAVIMAIPPHALPGIHWFWLIPVFVLQIVFNLGIAFFFARFGFHFPDAAEAVSFLVRILMYGSAVIFPIERFVQHETALAIIKLNPVYQFLECYRAALVDNTMPDPWMLLSLVAWSIGLLVLGFLYFWRAEEAYAIEGQ